VGDPLKKVLPGQALSIPAQAYNAFVDAALAHRGVGAHGPQVPERTYSRPPGLVRVRNMSGVDLPRFSPIGVSNVAISPTASLANFQNTPIFHGFQPVSSQYRGKFAVLQEPLANGDLGDAVLSGITVSPISVQHTTHDRADVDASGGSLLVTSYYGAAEILYAESGTGTKWAVLRLGSFVAPVLKATADAEISVGGSGSVTIKRNGVSAQTVTAHLNWMDGSQKVSAGNELLVQFFRDEAKWIIVGAECPT